MTFQKPMACVVLTLCFACQSEQDLEAECLPLDPDAGEVVIAEFGDPPSSTTDSGRPFVGRPLGTPRIGRLAGCTDTPPKCDMATGEGCANPFHSNTSDVSELKPIDRNSPCACELPQ